MASEMTNLHLFLSLNLFIFFVDTQIPKLVSKTLLKTTVFEHYEMQP